MPGTNSRMDSSRMPAGDLVTVGGGPLLLLSSIVLLVINILSALCVCVCVCVCVRACVCACMHACVCVITDLSSAFFFFIICGAIVTLGAPT